MSATTDNQGRKRRRRSIMVKFSASGDILTTSNDCKDNVNNTGRQLEDKDGNFDAHGDSVFDPCAEMMIHDYDDERTLEEEEALETNEDPQIELSDLQKEGDMPLNELLAMYGYGDECGGEGNGDDGDGNSSHSNHELAIVEKDPLETAPEAGNNESTIHDEKGEEEEDDNASVEEEPSALTQLYPDLPVVRGTASGGNNSATAATSSATEGAVYSSNSSRLLRSVSSSRPQSEEEDDDGDYSPEEEDWKKTIMVGSDYQAKIPLGLCKYDDALPYENDDKMLWNPQPLSERDIVLFLSRVTDPRGADIIKDDEQALYLLLQCGYHVEEALRRRRINAVPPSETMSIWSEEECRNFETGMRLYGKDFYAIQRNKVHTRSVGELVQFYYLWKKTERHDVYAHKARLEKKRHALHPGITDFMDRFLDEQEVGTSPHHHPPHNNVVSDHSKKQSPVVATSANASTDLVVDPLLNLKDRNLKSESDVGLTGAQEDTNIRE